MKKTASILLMALPFIGMSCAVSSAQTGGATPITVTSVSYANTGADTATIKASGAYANVAIQPVITKISGTVAGTAILYGSLDGINYVSISDTLTLTNVAVNTKIWNIAPSKYLYYRVRVVGSGTMGASFKAWFLGRQN